MALSTLDRIRQLAIISLFYDDDLLPLFVLKGGNALNMVYQVNNRSSMDIDISMENDFTTEELDTVQTKLERAFSTIFGENGYRVFDVRLNATPEEVPEEHRFWGGYTLEFKVIESDKFDELAGNIDSIRRQAVILGEKQQRKIKIDISKYEYVAPKALTTLVTSSGEYYIYVYTPVMVVYEKLRAICQQMEEYRDIIPKYRTPRARDFFDIHSIVEGWRTPIHIYDPNNLEMLSEIFAAKRVPLWFLGNLARQREFHRENFNAVRDTVTGTLESYDYYFDYVLQLVYPLETLWNDRDRERETAAAEEE